MKKKYTVGAKVMLAIIFIANIVSVAVLVWHMAKEISA